MREQFVSGSGLDLYEHTVLAGAASDAEQRALIQEGQQAYFAAIVRVGESYADALLEQMACALIHEAKAAV